MIRLLDVSKALDMLLMGRVADETERIGLVHKTADVETLMPEARAYAQELAQRPPMAVGHIMEWIYEGSQLPLKDGLALEQMLFLDLTQSEYVSGGQDAEATRDSSEET